ncbi:hypothetical protein GCM10010388_45730 [Streptomyces mauvecolor]
MIPQECDGGSITGRTIPAAPFHIRWGYTAGDTAPLDGRGTISALAAHTNTETAMLILDYR